MSARILDFVVAKLVSSRAIVSYSLSQSGLGSCSAHIRTQQSLVHTHTCAHWYFTCALCIVLCVITAASSNESQFDDDIAHCPAFSLALHCNFASIDSRDIPNARICEFASHCFTLARNAKLLENACEKSRCFRMALLLKLHVTCIRLAYVGVCVCKLA